STTPQFVHRRPIIDWVHGGNPVTRVPLYSPAGEAIFSRLGLPDAPVAGDPFVGKCAVLLGWLGPQYGPVWGNTLLVGDYASEWVRSFSFSESGELSAVALFNEVAGAPVWGGTNPNTNELWISRWQTRLDRLVPNPSGNVPPVAQANANTTFGPSPLTVEFVGEGSVDPDGTVLQWLWDFGDGFTSTAPNPIHTFTNQEAPNPTPRVVTLTVTDAEGDLDQETMLIGLDASPPEPNITSIPQGTTYGLTDDTVLELFGEVEDDDG
ncbi:MAG: PKD domain-containing protein, partial [Planctomycetota bacterium]